MAVVSNHFNDVRANRVFRIDPVNRFRGKTFAGMGAPRSNTFINTGVPRATERVFNGRAGRSFTPSSQINAGQPKNGLTGKTSERRYRAVNPFRADRVYSTPPGGSRAFTPRSGMFNPGETGGGDRRQGSQPGRHGKMR